MLIAPHPLPFIPLPRACAIAACFLGLVLNGCSDQKRGEMRWKVFGKIGEVDANSVVDLEAYEAKEDPLPALKELVGKHVTIKGLYAPIRDGRNDCEFLTGLGQLQFKATSRIKVTSWFFSDRMTGLWDSSMSSLPHWSQDTMNTFKLPLFVCDVPEIKGCYAPFNPWDGPGACPLDIKKLAITGRVTKVLDFYGDYYVYLVAEGMAN